MSESSRLLTHHQELDLLKRPPSLKATGKRSDLELAERHLVGVPPAFHATKPSQERAKALGAIGRW